MAERPDVVVIGASAGGVEALRDLVAGLPAELGAAVFVVLHVAPTGGRGLARILRRSGAIPVEYAVDGEPIRAGIVMLAPPDHHLVLDAGIVRVTRGPRENNHRPSIDVLFRSAARHHGPRVTGVVLSGTLDDGTEGLHVIRRHGGTAIVQDPAEAMYPSMPRSAIDHAGADVVMSVREIGPYVAAHVGDPPERAREEDSVNDDPSVLPPDEVESVLLDVSCPSCSGTLHEEGGALKHYTCRVGHSWTLDGLVAAQGEEVETAMWVALRTLQERIDLLTRLAERAKERGHALSASRLHDQALDSSRSASTLRKVLESLPPSAAATTEELGERGVD